MLKGIILTDTKRLASILSSLQKKVASAINAYVDSCSSYINWQIIDLYDEMYANEDKDDWHTYASTLNDHYWGLGLQSSIYCPLFILGGNDIVPMPPVYNNNPAYGREYLFSDMVYCFDTSEQLNIEDFINCKPRFAVGRLPLTKEWNLKDFTSYLDDCVDYAECCLPNRGTVMTTTQSWLQASTDMMRDIPTVSLSEDFVPLNNRMIVSPDLDTDIKEMYNGYVHELKKVDFLVCNLHGSDARDYPSFFGEDSDHTTFYTATQPSMMEKTAPIIFNTVACYGARYYEYESKDIYKVKESMLLSALAYGTMLFCGSCDEALGSYDRAGCSELMMKLYDIYLYQGYPAGMALIKAKQDYYRTCYFEDGEDDSMYTILEFNLFGCPILSIKPKLGMDYQPLLLGQRIVQDTKVTYRQKKYETIAGGNAYRADDIHAYVRDLVDNNLSSIRNIVEEEVYKRLGLGRDNLQKVIRVSQDNLSIGYQFQYVSSIKQSYRHLEMYYIVSTDMNGKIKKITHTK